MITLKNKDLGAVNSALLSLWNHKVILHFKVGVSKIYKEDKMSLCII